MERIGPYRILNEVAHGAAGVVYRARDEALERDVAIKVLIGHGLGSPVELERFRGEARAAARLRHPGIVAVHTAGVVSGRPYLVLDLVDGPSLDLHIRRTGPLPQREAARLTAGVARALHYAHKQGVIHRDVKPGNILVSGGEPLLTDFGLAKSTQVAGGLTATGEVLGTPGYMPPEQANGGRITVASDVYALGATLYHLLTGQPPFHGTSSVLEMLERVLTELPAPPSSIRRDLDGDLEEIVLKCMAKEPNDRYLDAATVAVELEAWSAGQASTDLIRAERRGRGALLAVSSALLIAVGAAAWLGARQHRLEKELATLRGATRQPAAPVAPPPAAPARRTARAAAAAWLIRARVKHAARDWRGALASIGKALDVDPDSVTALRERGRLWLEIGCAREAVQDYKRAVALDPQPDTHYELAQAQLADGDFKGLVTTLKEGVKEHPSARLHELRGDVLLEAGDAKSAAKSYTRALELDASRRRPLLRRMRASVMRSDPARARRDLDDYLRAHPNSAEALVFRGELTEDPRKALDLYSRGVSGEGRYADSCRLHRARTLARLADNREALATFRRYLDRVHELPDDHAAVQKRTAALAQQLEQDAVEPALSEALGLLNQDELERARVVLDPLLVKHPHHLRLLELLATIASEEDALDRSTALLERALERHPGNARIAATLIQHFVLLNKPEQARSTALRVLKKDPDLPVVLVALGLAQGFVLEERDAAMVSFGRAIALDPELGSAYGFRAKILMSEQRWGAAIRDLNHQLRHSPSTAGYEDRGRAYAALGKPKQAIKNFSIVLKIEPDDVGALLGRADAHRTLHHRALAIADYRKYLRLDPDGREANRVQLQLAQWKAN